MNKFITAYFNSWWLPAFLYIVMLIGFTLTAIPLSSVANVLLCCAVLALLGVIAACVWNLIKRRWADGVINIFLLIGCFMATFLAFGYLLMANFFGPSEDGFADNLTIPTGIEVAEPEPEVLTPSNGTDEMQILVHNALAVPGNDVVEFAPSMPSLRRASAVREFRDYIDASPDWHVFEEQGNRFASRRFSYGGEPRDELHGYISESEDNFRFQTRCLLCLDRKQWSRYSVQHVEEGTKAVLPEAKKEYGLYKSRVMIECGGVWVEIFEESDKPERRVTKAIITVLEKEFFDFANDPIAALNKAQARSRELARRHVSKDGPTFQLVNGMQPGIYEVAYSLNTGEPGSVYLKAFEVTKETPLSVNRLKMASKTRLTWSINPSEHFGATAGFTIYKGDWGKPYAARFEVWFEPDSRTGDRKIAERIFKIEGWQR